MRERDNPPALDREETINHPSSTINWEGFSIRAAAFTRSRNGRLSAVRPALVPAGPPGETLRRPG